MPTLLRRRPTVRTPVFEQTQSSALALVEACPLTVVPTFDPSGPIPVLRVTVTNSGCRDANVTVTTNIPAGQRPQTLRVYPGRSVEHVVDAGGPYDLTLTADIDRSWSHRLVGDEG